MTDHRHTTRHTQARAHGAVRGAQCEPNVGRADRGTHRLDSCVVRGHLLVVHLNHPQRFHQRLQSGQVAPTVRPERDDRVDDEQRDESAAHALNVPGRESRRHFEMHREGAEAHYREVVLYVGPVRPRTLPLHKMWGIGRRPPSLNVRTYKTTTCN